ncbi:MAG: fructose-6-phosphate aldolase [Firmicutes bacterium]|nr:fructose-6-phosphate aldolase [Bacillota bacterium]
MKLYLDTAEINLIEKAVASGIISGVTTNPSLLAKAGQKDVAQTIKAICQLVDGPVSLEVIGLSKDEMVQEAKEYAQIDPRVVIKIPMIHEGLKAIKELKELGIKTNATLIFSTGQGLLAALAGADYISPFIGRLDDISAEGLDVVAELAQIFDLHGIESEIIAASIRHPRHVIGSALAGAHIATVPWKIVDQMVKHPLTDIGLEKFLADWEKMKNQN